MKKQIDLIGKRCPEPVILTKKALDEHPDVTEWEIFLDNNIAVQNVKKLVSSFGYIVQEENREENTLLSVFCAVDKAKKEEQEEVLESTKQRSTAVVAVSSDQMGEGEEELGKVLLKGFLYALAKQDCYPQAIVFYNKGILLACEGSSSLEDLKELSKNGVSILICGTCLDYYQKKECLHIGEVTNMYHITEILMQAGHVIYP